MARIFDVAVTQTRTALAVLESGGLLIDGVEPEVGLHAGALRARHFDRTTSPLSLADCVALALAIDRRESLATADAPLADAAAAEGVQVVVLPDSHGRRPAR